MGLYTLENGGKIGHKGWVDLFIRMETLMKENGRMIRLMDMESIQLTRGQCIGDNGKKTSSMERDMKNGRMEKFIKENIRMG